MDSFDGIMLHYRDFMECICWYLNASSANVTIRYFRVNETVIYSR